MPDPNGGTWAPSTYKEDAMSEGQTSKLYYVGLLSLKISNGKISGYILHFIFYILLYIHVTVALYNKNSELNPKITLQDAFCFIISGSWQNTPYYTTMLPVYYFTASSIFVLLIFLFGYFLPHRYIGKILCLFANIIYAYFTVTIITCFNSFVKCYTLIPTRTLDSTMFFLILLHIVVVVLFFLSSLMISMSPLFVVHPFATKSIGSSLFLVSYLVYVMHLNSYITNTTKAVAYVSVVISFAASVYVVARPIYKSRLLMTLFLSFSIYNTLLNLILAIEIDKTLYGVIMIIPGLLLSILIYYVIYPFLIFPRTKDSRIELAFFLDKTKVLNTLLNDTDWKHVKTPVLHAAGEVALNTLHPALPDILKEFARRKISSKEHSELEWFLNHYAIPLDNRTPLYSKTLMYISQKELEDYEKEFWLCAWLSDTDSLPSLAAKIGDAKATYNVFLDTLKDSFPSLKDTDLQKYELTETNLVPKFRFFDGFIIVSTIIFLGLQTLLFLVMFFECEPVENIVEIQGFTHAFVRYNVYCDKTENCQEDQRLEIVNQFENLLHLKDKFSTINKFMTGKSETTSMSIEEVMPPFLNEVYNIENTNNSIMTILDQLSNFPEYRKENSKDRTRIFMRAAFHADFTVLVILLIMILLQYIVFRRKLMKKFDLFSKIPKDVSIQLGGFEPCYDIKSLIPYRHTYLSSFQFGAVVIFFVICIITVIAHTIILLTHIELNKLDLTSHGISINGTVIIERVLLYIAQGVAYNFYDESSLKFSQPFFEADDEICTYKHDSDFSFYINQVPDLFFELFGQEYIHPEDPLDVEGFQSLTEIMINNMVNATSDFRLYREFYILRFVDFIMITLLIQTLLFICLSLIKDYVVFETTEVDTLLNKARDLCEQGVIDSNTKKTIMEETFDIRDIDIPLFSINPDKEILFQSDKCKDFLKTENGTKIEDSALNIHVVNSLCKAIASFQQHYSSDPITIPCNDENNLSLILSPHYDFVEKQMELQYVIAVQTSEHSEEMKSINQKLNALEKASLPPTYKLDNLPIDMTAKGRHTIVGIIYLKGLNEWADKTDLKTVVELRSEMSAIVSENIESSDFLRMREEGNVIITSANYKSELTPWNMHVVGAETHRKIVDALELLFLKYNTEVIPVTFLFKTKATDFILPETKLGLGSLMTDSEFAAAERLQYCTKSAINYSPEKTETKLQSTTKIRSVVSPRKEKCDIFIIV